MPVEQIYCTHCTYGTSALEQREGELADRVLGYSARAGSEDRNALRNDYRAIERFLYYYLPSDTPPEEKQRLDAAAAPRRLFFCPSMGRLQMVGQVAYRQYDTAGRLGSYFAHVLFGDRSQGAWSPLDCLRLWDAPWVQEDTADHEFTLPALDRLDDVWRGAMPAIGDDVLLRFLQSSAGPEDDGGRVIAPRWLTAPQDQRIDLLANTLEGLLALGSQRRENVLLVVEPSVAALIFYGVVRLLPKAVAEGLSFSTYEPNAERLPVTLAATTFFDPFTADVRGDLYRRRGLVVNTFQDHTSESGTPTGAYARFMIEQLLNDGWPAIDHLLESFERAGAKASDDLDLLVPAHRAVSRVLSETPPDDDSWRKSEIAARYLAGEVQHQLITAPSGWPQLKTVIGTPNHLAVLELVAVQGMSADLQRPAQFLLKKFPPEKLPALLASPFVARWAKLEAVAAQVVAQGRLPEGCQLLATNGQAKTRASAGDRLLSDVLAMLPEPVLRGVCRSLDEAERPAFFEALLGACRQPSPSYEPRRRLLLELLSELRDADFLDVLVRYRTELMKVFPPPQPAIGTRLGRLLYQLPDHPKTFDHWLSVLNQWKDYFAHPNLAERRLAEWGKVRNALLALRESDAPAAKGRFAQRLKVPPRTDFKPLAEALNRAMPRRSQQLDELAEIAERVALSIPQYRARLELAAYNAGAPFTFAQEAAANGSPGGQGNAAASDDEQVRRRREQQPQMWQMFRELEERLLVYADDSMGNRKLAVLQQVGRLIVGRPNFLADGRQMIEAFFANNGTWPSGTILSGSRKKHARKLAKPRSRTSMYAVAGLSTAALVVLLGYVLLGRTPSANTSVADAVKPPTAPRVPKQPAENSASAKAPPAVEPQKHPPENATYAPSPQQPLSPSSTSKPSAPGGVKVEPPAKTAADGPPPESKTGSGTKSSETAVEAPPKMSRDPLGKGATPQDDSVGDAPPPNASATDAPAKATGPTFVEEAAALPTMGPHFGDHVWLKRWPSVPPAITLKLRGLEAANKNVGDRGRMTQEPQANGLTLGLAPAANGSGDSPISLARFVAEPEGLSFQWTQLSGETRSMREARDAVRRCVLEIGGAEPALLALSAPKVSPELLSLSNGRGTINAVKQPNKAEGQATEQLLLGGGDVLFQNGWRAGFDGPTGLQPYLLEPLPLDYIGTDAEVKLVQAKSGQWQLAVGVRFGLPMGDDALTIATDPKQRRQFGEDYRQLVLLDGNGRIREQRPEQKDVAALLSRLASNLGLKDSDLPALPDVAAKDERDHYKRDIAEKILRPAKRLDKQLTTYDWLQQHAEKVEAIIYRQVEPKLFARYLVYGNPDDGEPPVAGQSGPADEGK